MKTVYTSTVFKAIKIGPMCQNDDAIRTFLLKLVISTHVLKSICCPFFTSYSAKTEERVACSFPVNWRKGGGRWCRKYISSVPSKSMQMAAKQCTSRVNLRRFPQLGPQCVISHVTVVCEHRGLQNFGLIPRCSSETNSYFWTTFPCSWKQEA